MLTSLGQQRHLVITCPRASKVRISYKMILLCGKTTWTFHVNNVSRESGYVPPCKSLRRRSFIFSARIGIGGDEAARAEWAAASTGSAADATAARRSPAARHGSPLRT